MYKLYVCMYLHTCILMTILMFFIINLLFSSGNQEITVKNAVVDIVAVIVREAEFVPKGFIEVILLQLVQKQVSVTFTLWTFNTAGILWFTIYLL